MESANTSDIKAALNLMAMTLSSLAGEVGYLKAERWALEEAEKTAPQSVCEKVEALRHQDAYRNIRDGYVLVASSVQEAVNKILL